MLTKFRTTACLLAMLAGNAAVAADTALGKIIGTQGHVNPACRTVVLKENTSGTVRAFRIAAVTGANDDISAVVLAALVSNYDVIITYDPTITTGCGSEPRITVVSIAAP